MRLSVLRHLVWTARSQWWSAQRIAQFQERELVSLLRFACERVPFYRDLGMEPESLRSSADLLRFPRLTKQMLQASPDRFLADGLDKANAFHSRTSGSTGEPTITYFDAECWALTKYALKMRRIYAVTRPVFRRLLLISEQPPDEPVPPASRKRVGSGLVYAERTVSIFDDLSKHREVIRDFRPDMLYAPPSYCTELLRAYVDSGEPAPRIQTIFTSSEVLTDGARRRLESGFGSHVFDVYGTTELKEVAWQCRHGRYHLNFESVYAEPPPGDERPTLVFTTLCNRAMPLIRFETGDLGQVQSGSRCECGRQSPQLTIAGGRTTEIIELPDGRRLSPYLLTMLIESLPGLHQYRIVHEAPAKLTIEYVATQTLGADAVEECRTRLLRTMQAPVTIDFRAVHGFDRSGGRKHKIYQRTW